MNRTKRQLHADMKIKTQGCPYEWDKKKARHCLCAATMLFFPLVVTHGVYQCKRIQTLKSNTRIAHNFFLLGISISIIHRCNEGIWWPFTNRKGLTWSRPEVPYQLDKKLSQNKRTHSQRNKAAKCCGIKHALNSSVLLLRLWGKYLSSIIFTLMTF